jgi:cell division transport system permease protein
MALNANYVVRETTANLTRNITLTVASILTVFVSLAIVGATVLVRQGVQNATAEWKGGVEFMVYLQPDITEAERKVVEQSLKSNPSVKSFTYVDKNETYADFKKLFADEPTMLENVRKEDLPTRYKVVPTSATVESVRGLTKLYRKEPNVFEVRSADDVIRQIEGITTFFDRGLTIGAAFLLIASWLLILNTIRTAMFARRREIEVMKLVGATNWFIRVPFMLEGMVQGLIGGMFAVGFVFLAQNWLGDLIAKADGASLLQSFELQPGDVTLACVWVIVTAVLLSVLSSTIATRRFLDV